MEGFKYSDDISAKDVRSSNLGAAGNTGVGQLLWLTGGFIMPFLSIRPSARTLGRWEVRGTWGRAHTYHFRRFLSLASWEWGRKEKEDRQVRTPWVAIRGRLWHHVLSQA